MARILVIDDDSLVLMALRVNLERRGYQVELAADGHTGLALARSIACELLIVDIFMPGMDGLETIMRLRRWLPRVPIIAMSGFVFRQSRHSAPDFLRMATKLGATMSLHKPIRPADLLSAVDACIGHFPSLCHG
jgi:CheY-like chemotaxis protein